MSPSLGHTFNPPRIANKHCYPVGLIAGCTPEQRQQARIVCASNATDPADLALLLDVLDLREQLQRKEFV